MGGFAGPCWRPAAAPQVLRDSGAGIGVLVALEIFFTLGWWGDFTDLPHMFIFYVTLTRIEYWDRAGGGRNILWEISTTNEVHTRKWMRTSQKGLKMSCIHPCGNHSWTKIILENHGFDPFLSHLWSQIGPFSRPFREFSL